MYEGGEGGSGSGVWLRCDRTLAAQVLKLSESVADGRGGSALLFWDEGHRDAADEDGLLGGALALLLVVVEEVGEVVADRDSRDRGLISRLRLEEGSGTGGHTVGGCES